MERLNICLQLDSVTKELKQLAKSKEELEALNEALRKQSGDSSDLLSQQLKNLQENYKVCWMMLQNNFKVSWIIL